VRRIPALLIFVCAVPAAALAQAQPPLNCTGVESAMGIVARRDFVDDRGLVVKQIFYRSADATRAPACNDGALRVYSSTTITRDGFGRSVVETERAADGTVQRVLRHEYVGDSQEAARDIWYAPDGTRRYEVRRVPHGRTSQLYYDQRGLVAGVAGPLPKDVDYALRWGTEADGWSCGIALANASVYVNMKNGTQNETPVTFMDSIDMQLRSAETGAVPALSDDRVRVSDQPRGMSRLVAPGDAAFYTYSLEARYGTLPAGHYSIAVACPHPVSGVKVLSNRVEFDIATAPKER
jgi:hypothetical protein